MQHQLPEVWLVEGEFLSDTPENDSAPTSNVNPGRPQENQEENTWYRVNVNKRQLRDLQEAMDAKEELVETNRIERKEAFYKWAGVMCTVTAVLFAVLFLLYLAFVDIPDPVFCKKKILDFCVGSVFLLFVGQVMHPSVMIATRELFVFLKTTKIIARSAKRDVQRSNTDSIVVNM